MGLVLGFDRSLFYFVIEANFFFDFGFSLLDFFRHFFLAFLLEIFGLGFQKTLLSLLLRYRLWFRLSREPRWRLSVIEPLEAIKAHLLPVIIVLLATLLVTQNLICRRYFTKLLRIFASTMLDRHFVVCTSDFFI